MTKFLKISGAAALGLSLLAAMGAYWGAAVEGDRSLFPLVLILGFVGVLLYSIGWNREHKTNPGTKAPLTWQLALKTLTRALFLSCSSSSSSSS